MLSLALSFSLSAGPCDPGQAKSAPWKFAGPSTYVDRGLNITNAGAIQDVVEGPLGTWFVGSVNGGVWRTTTLSEPVPAWENVLDGQPVTCSAIAALHVSSSDPRRIFAGCGGATSSEQGQDWNVLNSGDWAGVMVSDDGGDTWAMLDGFPTNYYVTSILEMHPGTVLVGAQSHLWNASAGGIWVGSSSSVAANQAKDAGAATSGDGWDWTLSLDLPTFNLVALPFNAIIATHAREPKRSASVTLDSGQTWVDYGSAAGLDFKAGAVPFYTAAAVVGMNLVVAGLTYQADSHSDTDSAFFVRPLPVRASDKWKAIAQPTSMDEDSMPKDRMAILGDPDYVDLMYVAGNAAALAWRVNITSGLWVKMWDTPDVLDGYQPHSDCRNYAWDAGSGGRLLLVTDGGIFARLKPRAAGGRWVSLNGDIKEMEFLTAQYDNRADRFIAGAQDNSVQVFPPHATPDSVATGFIDGDGTVTLVDNVHNPSRLYGTVQFLGVGADDNDPSKEGDRDQGKDRGDAGDDDDGDDYDCGGLCFVQGEKFIAVPLVTYFPEPSSFPFFVQPYALNSQDPTQLVVWTNGTATRKSAFYAFSIPAGVESKKDILAPKLLLESPEGSFFLDFVSGGHTAKVADPSLVIGMDNANLYVRNKDTAGEMVTRPLPAVFAVPVNLPYDPSNDGARILGPLSHGATVSMAVSPSDSNVIAVTGWPSVTTNVGKEQVFVTQDAGKTWINATGNMREAAGVVGKVRPGGLLIVDLLANQNRALLVSTSNGVLVSYLDASNRTAGAPTPWSRFGGCDTFPITLTAGLGYEHYSDTIVAATMGRGVYRLDGGKTALLDARPVGVGRPVRVVEESSAVYFPEQHK